MIEKYNYNAVNCWQIFQHPFCKSGEFSFAKNIPDFEICYGRWK